MSNKIKDSVSYRIFTIFNYIFLISAALLCVLPMIQVLAVSFSNSAMAEAGKVKLLPVKFTLESYSYLIANKAFWLAMWVSIKRIFLGGIINMALTIIVAYPMSKDTSKFPARQRYIWFLFFTTLFSGGLIPGYLVVYWTGLMDTIWAFIIPGATPIFHVILLLNFFRQLPKELDEAAFMDGAGHWTILWRIYVPTSMPALATLTLFTVVGHWNDWFSGLIFMNKAEHYPLQTYLQTVIVQQDFRQLVTVDWRLLSNISKRTLTSAQIFVGAIPILLFYPFLQKYFTKGIVLGSVKG